MRDADASLDVLRLRPLHYAVRPDIDTDWHVLGPVSDAELDDRLGRSVIDEQSEALGSAARAATDGEDGAW